MRPMELVLTGAAACTAFDVVLILKKARQPVADCAVEAEAERAADRAQGLHADPPRYTVAGRGLDPQQVERAVKLSKEKYCSATLMLAKTAEITYEIAIVEGDRGCRARLTGSRRRYLPGAPRLRRRLRALRLQWQGSGRWRLQHDAAHDRCGLGDLPLAGSVDELERERERGARRLVLQRRRAARR